MGCQAIEVAFELEVQKRLKMPEIQVTEEIQHLQIDALDYCLELLTVSLSSMRQR